MFKSSFPVLAILVISLSLFSQGGYIVSSSHHFSSPNLFLLQDDIIEEVLISPHLLNMSQLAYYDYHSIFSADSSFRWKVILCETKDNFHIKEGDKRLSLDDIVLLYISDTPALDKTNPYTWGQLYVNELMARYPTEATANRALFKYCLPIGLNLVENFTSEYYLSSTFLDYYEENFNYTSDFVGEYYGKIFNYTESGFFSYLENSPFIDRSYWTFEEETVSYKDSWITFISNQTQIEIIFQRETGLMNELHYQAQFINGIGNIAGANVSIIRLNEDGFPYNYTSTKTLSISFTVSVVIAITLNLVGAAMKRKKK